MKTAFFTDNPGLIDAVYADGRRARLADATDLYPVVITRANAAGHADALRGVEAVFSTWGLWNFSDDDFRRLPALRGVFYAAGAADAFAHALIGRGVDVFTAWRANSRPVAEFVAGQIWLGLKGFFRNVREVAAGASRRGADGAFVGPGAYRETVALLGNGAVARMVRDLLATGDLEPLMIETDPSQRRVSFAEAFARAFVVSNHLPNLPTNQRVIDEAMLRSMRPGAVFINSGRGAQVDTDAMARVAGERADLTFLLDVTDPEPLPAGHPLLALPNVLVSTHIAGSKNTEWSRMADDMLDDFDAWRAGRPTRFGVDARMLLTRP